MHIAYRAHFAYGFNLHQRNLDSNRRVVNLCLSHVYGLSLFGLGYSACKDITFRGGLIFTDCQQKINPRKFVL